MERTCLPYTNTSGRLTEFDESDDGSPPATGERWRAEHRFRRQMALSGSGETLAVVHLSGDRGTVPEPKIYLPVDTLWTQTFLNRR
jgi:hypothetical protein